MDLIQQYIFGSASNIKEVEGVNKRLIKESSGGNIFNTLEIVAIMVFLNPPLALSATDDLKKSFYPFFSRGKPIESNKDEEEYDDSAIEENYHIEISKMNKIQSAT